MNEIAEKGLAAHWKYKGAEGEKGLDDWLSKVREVLEAPESDATEFLDDFKLSLYSKEIFVFTPKGDLRKFPAGATVLDFAYDVHLSRVQPVSEPVSTVKCPYGMFVPGTGEVLSKNQSPKIDCWLCRYFRKARLNWSMRKGKDCRNGKETCSGGENWKIQADENIRKLLKNIS
jgi:GTP pyrophosphokinase